MTNVIQAGPNTQTHNWNSGTTKAIAAILGTTAVLLGVLGFVYITFLRTDPAIHTATQKVSEDEIEPRDSNPPTSTQIDRHYGDIHNRAVPRSHDEPPPAKTAAELEAQRLANELKKAETERDKLKDVLKKLQEGTDNLFSGLGGGLANLLEGTVGGSVEVVSPEEQLKMDKAAAKRAYLLEQYKKNLAAQSAGYHGKSRTQPAATRTATTTQAGNDRPFVTEPAPADAFGPVTESAIDRVEPIALNPRTDMLGFVAQPQAPLTAGNGQPIPQQALPTPEQLAQLQGQADRLEAELGNAQAYQAQQRDQNMRPLGGFNRRGPGLRRGERTAPVRRQQIVGAPVESPAERRVPSDDDVLIAPATRVTARQQGVASSDQPDTVLIFEIIQDVLDIDNTAIAIPKRSRGIIRVVGLPSINRAIQNRIDFALEGVILPDGNRISFKADAHDIYGQKGIQGDVNHHFWWKAFGVIAHAVGNIPRYVVTDNAREGSARQEVINEVTGNTADIIRDTTSPYIELDPTTTTKFPVFTFIIEEPVVTKAWARFDTVRGGQQTHY